MNITDQSSYCNFTTERGSDDNKKVWNIDMNEAKTLCLVVYYKVNCIDHLVQNICMSYHSFKYWHSSTLHAKDLVVITAYGMYLGCVEGQLGDTWKVERPMSFWEFCEKLSWQILSYMPSHHLYPTDERMLVLVVHNQEQKRKQGRPSVDGAEKGAITEASLSSATHTRHKVGRLCGDLEKFQKHIDSVTPSKNAEPSEVCDLEYYTTCDLYKKSAVYLSPKNGR